jgi:hypothetical protein
MFKILTTLLEVVPKIVGAVSKSIKYWKNGQIDETKPVGWTYKHVQKQQSDINKGARKF